jgi:hypothetical protein
MSQHDAFLEFVLRLEALRQKQELDADTAQRLLRSSEDLGISIKAEASAEMPTTPTEPSTSTKATEAQRTRTPTATSEVSEET